MASYYKNNDYEMNDNLIFSVAIQVHSTAMHFSFVQQKVLIKNFTVNCTLYYNVLFPAEVKTSGNLMIVFIIPVQQYNVYLYS